MTFHYAKINFNASSSLEISRMYTISKTTLRNTARVGEKLFIYNSYVQPRPSRGFYAAQLRFSL